MKKKLREVRPLTILEKAFFKFYLASLGLSLKKWCEKEKFNYFCLKNYFTKIKINTQSKEFESIQKAIASTKEELKKMLKV